MIKVGFTDIKKRVWRYMNLIFYIFLIPYMRILHPFYDFETFYMRFYYGRRDFLNFLFKLFIYKLILNNKLKDKIPILKNILKIP